MKWIIIDLRTRRALYGISENTLCFSSSEIAMEVASQFFKNVTDFIVVPIKTPDLL